MAVVTMEDTVGAARFLIDLRAQLMSGSFRPLPVRERLIPRPGAGEDTHTQTRRAASCSRCWPTSACRFSTSTYLHKPWEPGGAMSTGLSAQSAPRPWPAEMANRPRRRRFPHSRTWQPGGRRSLRRRHYRCAASTGVAAFRGQDPDHADARQVQLPRLPHPVKT